MDLALIALSLFLAAALLFAAFRKLARGERTVASYASLGVPKSRLAPLALLLLAAAAGLLLGFAWPLLGAVSAAAIVCYFFVATIVHLRANDVQHVATPLLLGAAAAVVLWLRVVALDGI